MPEKRLYRDVEIIAQEMRKTQHLVVSPLPPGGLSEAWGQCRSCGMRRLPLESRIVATAFYAIRLRKETSQHSTVSLLTYLQHVASYCIPLNSFPYYHQARTLLTTCLPHHLAWLCFAASFSFLSPNSDFLESSSILCDNFSLHVFWIAVNNNPSVF